MIRMPHRGLTISLLRGSWSVNAGLRRPLGILESFGLDLNGVHADLQRRRDGNAIGAQQRL